jgi:hypothetical protein
MCLQSVHGNLSAVAPKKTDLIIDLRRWRIAGDRLQIALLTKAKAEAFEWASFTGSHGKET